MIILQIITGLSFLTIGGEFLVRAASHLGRSFGLSKLLIGLTIVAFGTSSPELFVSIQASLIGNGSIAIGNVIGSNIFNVLVILGICSMIIPLTVSENVIRRDIPIMIGISILFYAFALLDQLFKVTGFILTLTLLIYILFNYYGMKSSRETKEDVVGESGVLRRISLIIIIIISLVLLGFGAQIFVAGASLLASHMGVSDAVIALTLVSAGTSFPELVTSIIASIRGERDIAIGNIIGSNIFNILAVAGLTSLLSPAKLDITKSLLQVDFPVMIITSILCFPIFFTGKVITRKEGFFFFISYLIYVIFLLSK